MSWRRSSFSFRLPFFGLVFHGKQSCLRTIIRYVINYKISILLFVVNFCFFDSGDSKKYAERNTFKIKISVSRRLYSRIRDVYYRLKTRTAAFQICYLKSNFRVRRDTVWPRKEKNGSQLSAEGSGGSSANILPDCPRRKMFLPGSISTARSCSSSGEKAGFP